MPDVFISYARQDKDHASGRGLEGVFKRLAPELSIWRDDRISAGSAWSEDIATNLRQAKSVVVIWSNNSWNSPWVRQEAFYALMRGVLVPMCVDDVIIEAPFNGIQCAKPDAKGFDAVIAAVKAKVAANL